MELGRQPTRHVTRLRSLFMGHSLPQVFGCSHKPYALMTAGNMWADRQVLNGLMDNPYQDWRVCFRGGKIRDEVRIRLCAAFPMLSEVYNNPLWEVLRAVATQQPTDSLVEHFKLDGHGISGFSNQDMERLCGVPNWQRFGLLLAVLFSSSWKWQLHSLWLQRNFSSYFEIASLREPLCFVSTELYEMLSSFLAKRQDIVINNWPETAEALHQSIKFRSYLFCLMREMRWVKDVDDRGYELLWKLMDRHWARELKMLLIDSTQGRRSPCSTALLQSARRALDYQRRTQLQFVA